MYTQRGISSSLSFIGATRLPDPVAGPARRRTIYSAVQPIAAEIHTFRMQEIMYIPGGPHTISANTEADYWPNYGISTAIGSVVDVLFYTSKANNVYGI